MPKVIFDNVNQTCEAEKGESILDVAIRNDVPLQHSCGGFCACTTCHVHVLEGAENLSPQDEEEKDTIFRADGRGPTSRLSCQSKIQGDVKVKIINLD